MVYDREYSAIALAKPSDISWDDVFEGVASFHTTGITPAISASAAELAIESMCQARAKGVTVSFDLNYRRTLWKWGKSAPQVLSEMIHPTDILIGNEEHLRFVIGLPERMGARE